ncbi:hypothetical protein CW357_17965 [Rummeliibacillus sp. TYF005]|uniref:hypothetical protein n=1 Tax=Rummeliibacillus sp. TYF005 TaxID=2058214 RepID=UPI000F51C3E5|nr:hypothetical protein [Rummeliibacillus sp. TYF005]RPJ93955.1 hypothetical protein CW357_17965 [Rummeliibacillus sp. TYF005]
MKKSVFSLCILFIFLGAIFIFANQSYANKTLENDTSKILKNIKDKTYPKYKIGTYKISSDQIDIEIIGDLEYYYLVKDEVKNLVKDVIKSTELKNYSININQSKTSRKINKEDKRELDLLGDLYTNLSKFLSETYPNQIEQININNTTQKLSVKLVTLNNKTSANIGEEIENGIYEFLKTYSNELVNEKSIDIYVGDKKGRKIN